MAESPERRAKRLAYMKAWREANRGRFLAAQQRWRSEHIEESRARRREWGRTHKTELAAYRAKNAARISGQKAASRRRHIEAAKARDRRYYAANADRIKARVTQWAAEHRADANLYKRVSEGRHRAGAGELTARQWKEILLFYGQACAACHVSAAVKPLTIDHFIPIARGGRHDWKNVWPLCFSCNRKKSTAVPPGAPPHAAVFLQIAARKEAIA